MILQYISLLCAVLCLSRVSFIDNIYTQLVLCVCFVDRCLFFSFCCTFYFGHCVVCSSVFWPLCCLSFCLLAIVLSVLLSFGHCVVCPSVFWPLCCLIFFDLQMLITPLVSSSSSYTIFLLDFWTISIVLNLLGFFFSILFAQSIFPYCVLSTYIIILLLFSFCFTCSSFLKQFTLYLYDFSIGFWNYSESVVFIFFCKCIRLQYISVLCAIGLNSYFTAILGLFHMQFYS